MDNEFRNVFQIENYLTQSIENNELDILYQPIVDTKENRVVGVESLLRWNSAKLGAISPDRFIPIAETNGFIIELGKWVLNQSCRQGKAWHDKDIKIYMSVNVGS